MLGQLFVASVSPGSQPAFRREIEQAHGEILETLDEFRFLVRGGDRNSESLFCLHRFPVDIELTLANLEFDSVRPFVWEEGLKLPRLEGRPFSVQLVANRRMDWSFSDLIETLVGDLGLPRENFAPRKPDVVLSAYLHQRDSRCRLFAGVSTPQENLSPWSSGHCRIPRDPDSVSRAEAKLTEAWEAFGLSDHHFALKRAVDLGAAPGGWSRVLTKCGFQVDAVDPADLDPKVSNLQAVCHHRQTAGGFLATGPTHRCDLLVNDMKMEPRMAADLLASFASRLDPATGRLLTTLKLGKESLAEKDARQALKRLAHRYEILSARQLYFNRSEITVLARPLPLSPS